jgi:hypothetical protein
VSAATDIPSDAILQYCRTARRLRHRLRHSPAALHGSLRSLKPATPVAVRPVRQVPSVFDAPPAQRFALLVRYSLVGSLLPYSTRQALIRKAARMGIKRFDANLIIATVQHRAGGLLIVAEQEQRGSRWVWWIAIGVQVAIGVCIYRLLR